MSDEYFGYKKETKGPGEIVTANMVLLSIGGKQVRLAQTVRADYNRQVQPQYELGSDSVWMVAGRSTGTCNVDRAVGDAKLLEPYKPNDPCEVVNLYVGKGSDSCGMDPGKIVMEGCLLQQVGFQFSAQQLTVTDNAVWVIGKLS